VIEPPIWSGFAFLYISLLLESEKVLIFVVTRFEANVNGYFLPCPQQIFFKGFTLASSTQRNFGVV
jgi:hypothetical protein